VIGAVAAALIPMFASPAGAGPAPNPGQQAVDARSAANDAAARYADIQSRYDALDGQIVALEQKIQAGEARATELRAIAQRRMLTDYFLLKQELAERVMARGAGEVYEVGAAA